MNEINAVLIFYPQIQKILTFKIVYFLTIRYTIKDLELNLNGLEP